MSETLTGERAVRGYIDGCFDIMHSGHYNAIRQACHILSSHLIEASCVSGVSGVSGVYAFFARF